MRPYPKVISSRYLLLLFKFIFRSSFDFVRYSHGLNLYRTEPVTRISRFGRGHGIQISLIVPVYFLGGAISRVQVSNNFINFLRLKFIKFPSSIQVLNVFKDLI